MSPSSRQKFDEFRLLWDCLPHPPGGVVRVFARGGDERDGDFARSAAQVRRFARSHDRKNVYVAPNPTQSTRGTRHSAAEVSHWSYLLIDMDPVEKKYDAEAALEAALLWLGEWVGRDFSRERPIVVYSGRGYQAWLRLEDVELDDDAPLGKFYRGCVSRKTAARVCSHWLKKLSKHLGVNHGCQVDTSVSDLPRVMRCPGTTNVKTGKLAKLVHPTDRVHLGLAQLLVHGTPESAVREHEQEVPAGAGGSLKTVFRHLTLTAQTYIIRGQEEPGRHKVMWHTAKKLQEAGMSRERARRVLQGANSRCGKKEELAPDQVEHALDTAYGALPDKVKT